MALVQSRGAISSGSVASLSLAFSSNLGAGNLLVVSTNSENVTAITVSDTRGHTWNRARQQANGNFCTATQDYAYNSQAGADTVTTDPTGSDYLAICIMELSGMDTTSAVLGPANSGTGTSTTPSSGNVSPTATCALIGQLVREYTGSNAINTGTDFTQVYENENDASAMQMHVQRRLDLASGTYSSPWTTANSYRWAALVVAYYNAASGVNGTLTQTLAALTSAGVGTVEVQGTSARTLGALTSAGAGTVEVQGTSAKALGALTSSSAGAVDVQGGVTRTLDALTLAAAGTVGLAEITGTLDKALGALTGAGQGTVEVRGTSSQTLGVLSVASAATVEVQATAAPTLAALTSASAGTVEVKGVATPTLAALASASVGTVEVKGATTGTLDALVLASAGVVGNAPIEGVVVATLGALASSSVGTVEIQGATSSVLAALTAASAGSIEVRGAVAVTLAGDVLTAAAGVAIQGATSAILAELAVAGAAGVEVRGALTVTLGALDVEHPSLYRPTARPGEAYTTRQTASAGATSIPGSANKSRLGN